MPPVRESSMAPLMEQSQSRWTRREQCSASLTLTDQRSSAVHRGSVHAASQPSHSSSARRKPSISIPQGECTPPTESFTVTWRSSQY